MTTIKLNFDLNVKGCDGCPFIEDVGSDEEPYYICGLILKKHDNYVVPAVDESDCEDSTGRLRDVRPDVCPIISIEH